MSETKKEKKPWDPEVRTVAEAHKFDVNTLAKFMRENKVSGFADAEKVACSWLSDVDWLGYNTSPKISFLPLVP
jgi:hypothetical protein